MPANRIKDLSVHIEKLKTQIRALVAQSFRIAVVPKRVFKAYIEGMLTA